MSSVDCAPWANNASCDGMICNTDWTTSAAQSVKNGYCKPLTGSYAVCGTACSLTKWGNDCCSASDWASCFADLAKKGCANGGSNSMSGKPHALGSTSVISTVTGHALQVTSTATGTLSAATTSHTSGSQTGASATTSSMSTATSRSSATRHMGVGAKMIAGIFAMSVFANILL